MSESTRHAVVTGGGSGIGAAIAAAFDAAGIPTTIMGRSEEKLEQTAAGLKNADIAAIDVSDPDNVAEVFAGLASPVDILVNNAGIAPSAPFHRQSVEDWHNTFAVNTHGAFYCTQSVIGGMVERNAGRVINIASTSAQIGYAYVAAYCASKPALLGLTRALATEYANKDITFNAICPGFAETEILSESVDNIVSKTGRSEDQARAALAANNPQKRFIQPEEVAAAAMWLISHEARSVTGQAISISGGEVS